MNVKVGDSIRIVNARKSQGEYDNGDVLVVEAVSDEYKRIKAFDINGLIFFSEFRVIGANDIDIEIDDMVNQPSHYTVGGIQPIEYMRAKMTDEGYKGFLLGNVIKYVSRYPHKNGLEDLKKTRWYLDKLIGEVESGEKANTV